MGLLDALLGNAAAPNSGYGGLASYFLYPGNKPEAIPQPQYDAMGNYTGVTPGPVDPFGPIPQSSAPSPFQPPSVFTGGTAPLAGLSSGVLQGHQAPQIAPQAPAPQPPVTQVNDIGVGGYQMPRLGTVADYTAAAPTDVSARSRQPVAAAPVPTESQEAPISFGNSFFSRLGNPDGLIARLTGNDTQSVAQKKIKAQYDSLVPLVGPQKAMLAIMNPEAGKIILGQALEKKQYGFQKMEDGTLVRTDPMTGNAELAYGSNEPSKGIAGPDGKIIQYPEGLDAAGRKIFANEIARINADAAAGKRTGEQATAEIFANKMELSNRTLSSLANQGASLTGRIASGLPLGNYIQSPEYQRYKQAASNFITALLRKESGAAIGKEEFDRYDKEYMPQPGDSREVLAQKAEARQIAIEGMKKGAGPAYKSPSDSAASGGAVRKYNPATGRIE